MIVSLIAALDQNGGIGKAGGLPWRLSADLQRFKRLTLGHHLLMGRRTFQSIGRALPGRTSLVLSREPGFDCPGCIRLASLEAALELAQAAGESELFVIGGGDLFTQTLALAQRLYLTHVQAALECDTFFPVFDPGEWREVEREETEADERNDYPTIFQMLERII